MHHHGILWVQSFWPFRAPPECLSSFPHGKSATLRGRCGRASRELGLCSADSVDPTECFPIKTSLQPAATYARYHEISRDIARSDRSQWRDETWQNYQRNAQRWPTPNPPRQSSRLQEFGTLHGAQDTVIVQPTMMEMPSTKSWYHMIQPTKTGRLTA